jgi:hypothetical protein
MALDPGSVSGQVDSVTNKLAEYFSNMRKFVADSTGVELPPDFDEYVNELDYSELYRMTNTRYSDSASFENGAAIEVIHMLAAIVREYTLRTKGKIDYYSDAESEYLTESNYYSTMRVFWMNMINGNYIEGKTS